MPVLKLYREFRARFPELTHAADARHIETWEVVDERTAFIWFESLAGAVNDRMAAPDQEAEIASVFQFFAGKLGSDAETTKCIDVSFVENLYWQVTPNSAARVWGTMPQSLQKLYIDFHGRAPSPG